MLAMRWVEPASLWKSSVRSAPTCTVTWLERRLFACTSRFGSAGRAWPCGNTVIAVSAVGLSAQRFSTTAVLFAGASAAALPVTVVLAPTGPTGTPTPRTVSRNRVGWTAVKVDGGELSAAALAVKPVTSEAGVKSAAARATVANERDAVVRMIPPRTPGTGTDGLYAGSQWTDSVRSAYRGSRTVEPTSRDPPGSRTRHRRLCRPPHDRHDTGRWSSRAPWCRSTSAGLMRPRWLPNRAREWPTGLAPASPGATARGLVSFGIGHSAPTRIRTWTGRVLSALPLPIGLRGRSASGSRTRVSRVRTGDPYRWTNAPWCPRQDSNLGPAASEA